MATVVPLITNSTNRILSNGHIDADGLTLASTTFYRRWWHALACLFSAERRRHTAEEVRLLHEIKSLKIDVAEANAKARTLSIDKDKLEGECEVHKASIDNLNLAITMMDMRYKRLIARDAGLASAMLDAPEAMARPRRPEKKE